MKTIWLYIIEMYKMLYKIKGIWLVVFQPIQTPSLVRYQAALRTEITIYQDTGNLGLLPVRQCQLGSALLWGEGTQSRYQRCINQRSNILHSLIPVKWQTYHIAAFELI